MINGITSRLFRSEPIQRCRWPACRAACCLYGAWVDAARVESILAHAQYIAPLLPAERRDPQRWFDGRREADAFTPSGQVLHTRVLPDPSHYGGTACIFLRGDYKCALQVAGEAAGYHPWHFKPFYCVLHPLDLDDRGRLTLDETAALLAEPASCLRPAAERTPLTQVFASELRYLSAGLYPPW